MMEGDWTLTDVITGKRHLMKNMHKECRDGKIYYVPDECIAVEDSGLPNENCDPKQAPETQHECCEAS